MSLLSQIQENIRKSGSQDPELLRFIEMDKREPDVVLPPGLELKKKELEPKKQTIVEPIMIEPEPVLIDTSKIYIPKEKGTPGRKRKRGRKKEGSALKARVLEELPPVPSFQPKTKTSKTDINDCLKAVVNYLQVSDGFYNSTHDCNRHNQQCSTVPLIKKDYLHARQEVKRQCKI